MTSTPNQPSRTNTTEFTSNELSVSKFKDYYATLGINKNATESEIKSKYRSLIKQWHPDKADGTLSRTNSVVVMAQVGSKSIFGHLNFDFHISTHIILQNKYSCNVS